MNNKINHEYTSEIICPWCGYKFRNSWEHASGEEDIGLTECGSCGKHLYATRHIIIQYSTEKAVYGTCKHCGKNDVVVEDHNSIFGEYEALCEKCGWTELLRLREIWFKENT